MLKIGASKTIGEYVIKDILKKLVKDSNAISFAYKVIAEENPPLSYCTLKNDKIEHEFNYVGLLNVNLDNILKIIENN